MVPERLKSCFEESEQKKDEYSVRLKGKITCCHNNEFKIKVIGEKQRTLFSGMYLRCKDDEIALTGCCKHCGKDIVVFDNTIDEYDNCENDDSCIHLNPLEELCCRKCSNNNFDIIVEFEYSNIEELKDAGIEDIVNHFAWIGITLKCNCCNANYKYFIDYESA